MIRSAAAILGAVLMTAPDVPAAAGLPSTDPPVAIDGNRVRNATVHVEKIRFDAPPASTPQPAVVLKFDLINDTPAALRNPLIRVSISEKSKNDGDAPRVLVRPFIVRGTPVIEAGYTVNYEMLMQNISPDCQCVADVTVVTDTQLPDGKRTATVP